MILQEKIAFMLKLNVCILFNIILKLSQKTRPLYKLKQKEKIEIISKQNQKFILKLMNHDISDVG